ncbi:hypothetical protein FQA39_LY12506 [Lamprigera yunnana]|nr:hypothetical protein FQA39_LY12506 [Lamprigera yunnana]
MQIHLLVLTCILAKAAFEVQKTDNKPTNFLKVCSEKSKLDITNHDDYVKAMDAGEKEIAVFSECYLGQLGFLNENGTILYDVIKNSFGKMYSTIVDVCKDKKGDTTSETSYKFTHCLLTTSRNFHSQTIHTLKKNFAMKTCSNTTKISIRSQDDYVKKLNVGGEQVKLFSECYFRELGILDSNGTILYDKVKNGTYFGVPTQKYSSIIDHCKNERGSGIAEMCYKFSKCVLNNSMKKASTLYSYRRSVGWRVCSMETNFHIINTEDYLNEAAASGELIQLYSKCYLQELKCLDHNGSVLYEEVKKIICTGEPCERCPLYVDQCKNENGTNVIATAHKFLHCLISKINQKSNKREKLFLETRKQEPQKQQLS